MQLKHIALVCSSEEKSDRFYANLLGLQKVSSKELSSKLAKQIFDIDGLLQIINYANDSMHFEIFISTIRPFRKNAVEHICLQVDAVGAFLEKCREHEVDIHQIQRADSPLTFIRDYDGNLFEIK